MLFLVEEGNSVAAVLPFFAQKPLPAVADMRF